MSHLQGAGLPDFTKATISLWFRVPRESVSAAKNDLGYDPETMIGGALIPLLTFGDVTEGFNTSSGEETYSGSLTWHTGHLKLDENNAEVFVEDYPEYSSSDINYSGVITGFAGPVRLPPSMIAIDCSGDAPHVYVNLQMPNRANRTGLYADLSNGTSSTDVYAVTSTIAQRGTDPPPDYMRRKDWITIGEDVTDFILSGRPESFYGRSNVEVTPDKWHHLLLSFNLSGTIGDGSSDCRMWMALDDANCVRDALPAVTDAAHGANTIFAQGGVSPDEAPRPPQPHPSGWYEAGQTEDDPPKRTYIWIDTTITGEFQPSTYRFSPGKLVGAPLYVPAPGTATRKVQMAELQIFTGVTLDTSVEKNRRAFINSKGQPVDEAYAVAKFRGIYGPKSPIVTPAAPVKLLGKMPDVSLTRACGVWIGGGNLGTMREGFAKSGKIHPVRPDPVLGK